MDFFRILNAALSILAWLIVLTIIWAIWPYAAIIVQAAQTIHNFAK